MNSQTQKAANPLNAQGTSLKKPVMTPPNTIERRENEFSITIGKTPNEIYSFWREFSNLPLFMKDLSSIEVLSPTRSKWTVELKNGLSADWIAEVTRDIPGQEIAWETREGEIKTSGTVRFQKAPADFGTVVSLAMDYQIPGGKLTELATLFTGEDPTHLVLTNLKRLKGYLETGVIATIEGQSSGRDEVRASNPKSIH